MPIRSDSRKMPRATVLEFPRKYKRIPQRGQGFTTEIKPSAVCVAGGHTRCFKLNCTCLCHRKQLA